MSKEGSGGEFDQTLPPFELPQLLREFLAESSQYVLVANASNQGTLYIVKAPEQDIVSVRGRVPMRVTHELHREPQAPVLRSVVKIYDDPQRPLALETFTNVRDEEQRRTFAALAQQSRYIFAFYNQHLMHRLTKLMDNTHSEQTAALFRQALLASSGIPDQCYNFDQAKAAVMRRTPMG